MKEWIIKDLETLVEQIAADRKRYEELFQTERAEEGSDVAYPKLCGRLSAGLFTAEARLKTAMACVRIHEKHQQLAKEREE
jgi:hypothetical protein